MIKLKFHTWVVHLDSFLAAYPTAAGVDPDSGRPWMEYHMGNLKPYPSQEEYTRFIEVVEQTHRPLRMVGIVRDVKIIYW